MKKIVFAVAALALATTAAFADVIADRQAVMKENAKQVGTLAKMVKGEAPFDAAAVVAALTALNDSVQNKVLSRLQLLPRANGETGGIRPGILITLA